MQRTTTTAALLVTVAVTAVTGCVTVQRPPAPDPATGGARSSAPRPDGPRHPRAVEAPARESLELTDPAEQPDHGTDPAPRAAVPSAASPPAAPLAQPPAARPEPRPAPRPPRSEPSRRRPEPSSPKVPAPLPEQRGGDADLCALGRTYGGWRPGSPEAAICEQTYGR
ncbi:hypothetical protein AB0G32_24895 [Streptomyces sp. NPDC023723]|uniref:hypothetical protein n=1 Tax=Streptomyces sp. NPDC023723 TaxID=3154323 RepID=UPI00340A1F7E